MSARRRIETLLGHRLDLRGHIIPGGAQPQHRPHALAHPGDGIGRRGAFMVVRGAARRIGKERHAEIR